MNELRSKVEDEAGIGVGRENVVGSEDCVGIDKRVGSAQRSTCLPVVKLRIYSGGIKRYIPSSPDLQRICDLVELRQSAAKTARIVAPPIRL